MEPIKCIIVDDEPLGRDVLENYVRQSPNLNLVATCKNAFEADQCINSNQVDLIFLDINMPKLSGLSFVKALSNSPKIVFVTAYPEYAVEGFEVNAVDYLVKPVSLERFLKAVNKVLEQLKRKNISEEDSIFIKVDKKLLKINLNDIKYIEAFGDFLKVRDKEKVHIISETMKNLESHLPSKLFVRIHKSYLINLSAVEFIEGNQVRIQGQFLPIGATYKEELSKRVKP